ncbi:MAG: hypothetical protein HYX94_06695 [Chloroflexi bacterium]|nr:hypothetical protein [Chloroflexota bacterium]
MPSFSLQLAKAEVNDTLDIMGFRNSMLATFKAHHLAHGHTAAITGGAPMLNPTGPNQGVKDWFKQRDKAFNDQQ